MPNKINRHISAHGYFVDADSVADAIVSLFPCYPDTNEEQRAYLIVEMLRHSCFDELDSLNVRIVSGPIHLN